MKNFKMDIYFVFMFELLIKLVDLFMVEIFVGMVCEYVDMLKEWIMI